MPLALVDFQPGTVVQRTAGKTGRDNLPVRWTLDTAPGAVQARVLGPNGVIVADWATCTAQTATGGKLAQSIPQGDGYTVQIRDGAAGAVQSGTALWGVGVVVVLYGQSNQGYTLKGGVGGSELTAYQAGPKLARAYDNSGWHTLDVSAAAPYDTSQINPLAMGRELVAALGGSVPVGLVTLPRDGTAIEFLLPGTAGWNQRLGASGTGVGSDLAGLASPIYPGDFEVFEYLQGEFNADATAVNYKTNLGRMYDGILALVAPFGRTAQTLHYGVAVVGTTRSDKGKQIETVRIAQIEWVAEAQALGRRVFLSRANVDLVRFDDYHYGPLGAQRAMRRLIQSVRWALGAAPHSARGASITNAAWTVDGKISVTVQHDAGTALQTPGTNVTGFLLSADDFSTGPGVLVPAAATIAGPNVVHVTPPASIANGATGITLKYQGGFVGGGHTAGINAANANAIYMPDGSTQPDTASPLYDNAAIVPVFQGGLADAVVGFPVQPTARSLPVRATGETGGGTGTGTMPTNPTPTPAPTPTPSPAPGTTNTASGGRKLVRGRSKPIRRLGTRGLLLSLSALIGVAGAPATVPTPGTPATSTGSASSAAFPPAPAVGTRFVTLPFKSRTAVAGAPLVTGHPFPKGFVPAGHRVTAFRGTAEVAVQQDAETYWSDGSLKFAVLTLASPPNFAADETVTFALAAKAEAPIRTGGMSLATLATRQDFKLRFSGHDFGSEVFWARVNDFISGATPGRFGTNPVKWVTQWASGPLRTTWCIGGMAVRDGDGAVHRQLMADIYLSYFPAQDAWEILPYPGEFGAYAAHPAGTVGPAVPTRLAGICEVLNGTTRIRAFGGPDDPRARPIPATAFNATTNRVNLPDDLLIGQRFGAGVLIGFAGSQLPTGITATGVYSPWSGRFEGNGAVTYPDCYLNESRTNRYGAEPYGQWLANTNYVAGATAMIGTVGAVVVTAGKSGAGKPVPAAVGSQFVDGTVTWRTLANGQWDANSAVALNSRRMIGVGGADLVAVVCTTAGTTGATFPAMPAEQGVTFTDGTVTWRTQSPDIRTQGGSDTVVFPLFHCFQNGGMALGDDTAQPLWVGPGARPEILPAHDRAFLAHSRMFPPIKGSAGASGRTLEPYQPGAVLSSVIWALDAVSDSGDRIGPNTMSNAQVITNPHDYGLDRYTRTMGLMWADYPVSLRDQRSGRHVVFTNGPARDGVTYPEMGPVNPGFFSHTGNGGGNPSYRPQPARQTIDACGYEWNYSQLQSGSHSPNFTFVQYLRTGHPIYCDMEANNTHATVTSDDPQFHRNAIAAQFAEKRYGLFFGQNRSMAWLWRDVSNQRYTRPADHPVSALFDHFVAENMDYYKDTIPTAPLTFTGFPPFQNATNGAFINTSGSPWAYYFFTYTSALALWREDERWRPLVECMATYALDLWDDMGAPHGSGWGFSDYLAAGTPGIVVKDAAGAWFTTRQQVIAATWPNPAPPHPQYGFRQQSPWVSGTPSATAPIVSNVGVAYAAIGMAAQAMLSLAGIERAARVRQQLLDRAVYAPSRITHPPMGDNTADFVAHWSITPEMPALPTA